MSGCLRSGYRLPMNKACFGYSRSEIEIIYATLNHLAPLTWLRFSHPAQATRGVQIWYVSCLADETRDTGWDDRERRWESFNEILVLLGGIFEYWHVLSKSHLNLTLAKLQQQTFTSADEVPHLNYFWLVSKLSQQKFHETKLEVFE